jgi:hypothetical protein
MNVRKMITLALVVQVTTLAAAVALLGVVPGVRARLAMADSVRHFSLLAQTMQPVDSSIGYDNTDAFLKTVQESMINTSTVYIGQLDLPDGARIVSVRGFGLDTDPFFEFSFRLYRYNLYSDPVWSSVTDLASSGVSFQGGKVEVNAQVYADMAVIDNDQYSYGISLVLPTAYNPPNQDLGVLRFVVDTSYTAFLPSVRRDWTSR